MAASAFLLFPIFLCRSTLLDSEEAELFNHEIEGRIYTVTQNIALPFEKQLGAQKEADEIIFRKGEKVRIELETGDDWLKVRAYRSNQLREHSGGAVILFRVADFLEEQGEDVEAYSLERLRAELSKILK